MADERWQKVREVFDAALRHRPEDRQNYLNEVCGHDPHLMAEVKSLLASSDNSEGFLEQPAVAAVADLIHSQANRLKPGTRLSHYEVIRQINSGGMGEVYLAQDQKLDRRVAIKILNQRFSEDGSSLQRFTREAKAASALNHPNILVIHEIGASEGLHYIVSEFIEGRTLREVLGKKTLQLSEVLEISLQVAGALAAAHGARLVHRDIKPENLMVRPDGYVKILDFGLAKLVERQGQSVLGLEESTVIKNQTAKGVILGTVNYMSPEQAKGEQVDEQTDIFSLGVVLYEMIAGRTPFAADSISETFANLVNAAPPPLARFAANVPDELARIVSKMLRKKKDERYQTMKEVAVDLKGLKESLTWDEKLETLRRADDQRATAQLLARDSNKAAGATQSRAVQRWPRLRIGVALIGLVGLLTAGIIGGVKFLRPAAVDTGKTAGTPIRSIAVLPLANLSGDPAQEYFADGMTEAVITELGKIDQLRVISRQSIMQYKAARKTTPEIARELNVDAVVQGSVLRADDRVRITAQLIRAQNDEHLWSESYERDLRDVLALQGELARGIASEIKIQLTPQEQARFANARAINPAAHDAYLKGLYWLNQAIDESRTEEVERLHHKSFEYFQQAIKLDPNYALAHSKLATSYHFLATSGFPEFYPKAKQSALNALALDDRSAEAHGEVAYSMWRYEWDFAGAEKEFKRFEELASNRGSWGFAQFLSTIGKHEEAIRQIRLAQNMDPLILLLKVHVGWTYLDARQYDQAIAQFRTVLELEPNNLEAHRGLGAAYVLKGMHQEGIAECQRALDLSRGTDEKAILAWANAMAGKRDLAIKLLNDLKDPSHVASISHERLAMIYGALGERDLGMAHLERAYARRSEGLLWLKVNPAFDGLRSDPRFSDLLRRIGLPE
jgi:serine/threonine-protein kinase